MDIVKWLREFKLSTSDSNYNALIVSAKTEEAADEIERLRHDNKCLNEENFDVMRKNAELVDALKHYACSCPYADGCSLSECGSVARDAIAKATGGE